MVIKVMRENTFVKVLEGMHRFRYMECPVAKEMLRYKYYRERSRGGMFLELNTGIVVHR